jgi:membrane associated rhomboid family serine protease
MIPLYDDNPTQLAPVVTVGFITANVLVFFWMATLPPPVLHQVVFALGVVPAVLLTDQQLPPEIALVPPELTIFTSMFLHGGLMHLAGNMLYLWIFGNNVEDSMGHLRFVAFFLLCGIAAAGAQIMLAPESTVPMIGASGGVSGVLGAYLLLYPHSRILVFIPIAFVLRLPAMFVLGLWFLLQFTNALFADPEVGGVAFGAHVGGFVAGMVLVLLFRRRGVRLWNPHHGGRRSRWG